MSSSGVSTRWRILLLLWSGSNHWLVRVMYSIPTASRISPIGVKSKKRKDSKPLTASKSLTTILGGVPINVIAPPSREPKDKGINNLEGLICFLRLMLIIAGAITATVPVSLMNPESSATVPMIKTNNLNRLLPAKRMILLLMESANPDSITAPPTINKAAMAITIGLEKPARDSSGVKIPVIIKPNTNPRATRSTSSHSVKNNRIVAANNPRVIQPST